MLEGEVLHVPPEYLTLAVLIFFLVMVILWIITFWR